MILFFDTETTGLVKNWNNPLDDRNPDLVQIGLTVCTDDGRSVFTYGSLVTPYYDHEIEQGALEAHGISREMCEKSGISIKDVTNIFCKCVSNCGLVVAHNIKFDKLILDKTLSSLIEWPEMYCTMLESTNVCKIQNARGYKWPKLSEAYEYFFHEKLKDAHDALTDVMACKRVYFEGLKNGVALVQNEVVV